MRRLRRAPRPSSVLVAPAALLAATLSLSPTIAHAKRCPNIMFVVSRAANMGVGSPPTHFDLARQAVSAAVEKYNLPTGLVLFGSSGGSAQQCAADTVVIPVRHGIGPTIHQALYGTGTGGLTNLGDGIRSAVQDGGLDDPRRDNVLVVITAGSDDCHPVDPRAGDYGVQQVLEAARHDPPIRTAIFAFDGGVVSPVLNQMALAGGFANGCNPKGAQACYFGGGSQKAFIDDMDTLVAGLASTGIVGGCDDSCFGNPTDCAPGEVCDFPAPNQEATCVPDPCLNVACGAGQYCRHGQCTDVCPTCPSGTYCIDGQCLRDHCSGATWNETLQFCDPQKGVQPNKCNNTLNCPLPTYCDPATGFCIDNPCRLVDCPAHASCNASGYCEEDPPTPDLAVPRDLAAPVGIDAASQAAGEPSAGGCSCSIARGPVGDRRGLGDSLLLLSALALLRPRRRRA